MPLTRIITAIVLGAAVIMATLHLSAAIAASVFSLLLFIAALEWSRLAKVEQLALRLCYALVVVCMPLVIIHVRAARGFELPLIHGGLVVWLGCATWVSWFQWRGGASAGPRLVLLLGGMILVPALLAIHALLLRSPAHLWALFAIVWSADIFAYFGGRALGKRRLASRVSPGKTWEGLAAAAAGVSIGTLLWLEFSGHTAWLSTLTIVLLVFIAAVYGDLLESLLKRQSGLKDSGAILPGHGGVLDRVDSLLAAAPVFAMCVIFVER